MNKKELNEIRKRVRPDRTNIQRIYGCYVNGSKEIISRFDESVGLLSKEEQEKYIGLLKKTLSGALGKNLQNINFTTRQVAEGEEHKLLSSMRRTGLKDPLILDEFYNSVVRSLSLDDSNYLILLAFDAYDVPSYNKNGEKTDESENVFNYILCCVCPVKTSKPVLHYSDEEKCFHNLSLSQIVGAPEIGFMFPAFDDRAANIYSALFYSRDTKGMHGEFIDAVFKTEVPMSPRQQQDAFTSVIAETLEKDCNFDVIQAVHEELRERIAVHKDSKDPEPLELTVEEVEEILEKSGMDGDKREDFISNCTEQFGKDKLLAPDNIISSKKFELATEQVKISVSPEFSGFIRTEVIDGKKYILIPADGNVEVNGINITI